MGLLFEYMQHTNKQTKTMLVEKQKYDDVAIRSVVNFSLFHNLSNVRE